MKSRRNVALTLVLFLIQPHVTLSQWVRVIDSTSVVSFAMNATRIFAGADESPYRLTGFHVLQSTSSGTNWTAVNHSPGGTCVNALAVSGPNLVAATDGGYYGGGVYISTNNGVEWIATGPILMRVFSFAVKGPNLFGGSSGSVFLSTDNGVSWTAMNNGLPNTFITALRASGTTLFAGTGGSGVYVSTNEGVNWTQANSGLTNTSINAFATRDNNVFAGTWGGGIFLSTNNGAEWVSVNNGLTNLLVLALAVSSGNLFAGTGPNGGVFLSTNNGASWTSVNEGLTDLWVSALCINGPYLFCAARSGVWRRPLSEMVSTGEEPPTVPEYSALGQNYPNPFNPKTTILYQIAMRSHVILKVVDVLGRDVVNLVNEIQDPGYKAVQWDARDFPSGSYFYQLKVGSLVETRRMVFTK